MNFKKILKSVKEEHKKMERCPKCKSKNVDYIQQHLMIKKGKYYDLLVYYCSNCNKSYEKKLEVEYLK